MGADDAGEVFFAAEGSAGFGLDDAALFGGEVEDEFEGVDEVVGALHGAGDGDSSASGCVLGDDAVVFDVELLLGAGAVLAFDDEVGGGEDLFEFGVGEGLVALLHEEGLEGVWGVLRVTRGWCQMTLEVSPAAPSSDSSMVKTPGSSS